MKLNPDPAVSGTCSPLERRTRRVRFVLFLSLNLGLPAPSLAASGDLDPSLDGDGRALTDFGGFDRAFAVVAQPDGKVVAAGASSSTGGADDFALARYDLDGSLDASFGAAGTSLTSFGLFAQASALVRQPDGKLVAAGTSIGQATGIGFTLARYTTGGTLDTSFGFSGSVHDNFDNIGAVARALVVQPDGKLVAAGFSFSSVSSIDFALARYNADGVLDTSFGSGGHAVVSAAGEQRAFAVAIQQDGKLVAAGTSAGDFALARFNESGIPDPNFGPGGIKLFDFGGFDTANAVVVQPDGKLVAAGLSGAGSNADFALVRFNEDGTPDTTFGFNGRRLVDFGDLDDARALVLRPGGKLVAAGFSNTGNDTDFVVVQFNNDGSLDTSFGSNGVARTSFSSSTSREGAFAVTLDTDGKLVAAGTSDAGGDLDFALARYVVTEDPLASRRFCNNRAVTAIRTPRSDRLRGTNGDDVILGLGGNDTIRALGGNDTICGGAGRDVLIGGPGRDRLLGEGGPDKLFGGAGNDVMNGGAGKNRCNGGQGRDSHRRCEATRATPPKPPRPSQAPPVSIFCSPPLCGPLIGQ